MERETGESSVTISINSKGEAQVSVKVYALPPESMADAIDVSSGTIHFTVEGHFDEMERIADLAVAIKKRVEASIRNGGGRVAGDALKGGA